jgi:pimeloyl-ACP methyl ester carboxylesterase
MCKGYVISKTRELIMDNVDTVVIFLVGLGAPASLYTDYINDLKKRLPYQPKLFVLEWWNECDFGINELKIYINNSEVILIGHSAGSVIALQTLAQWPHLVKKIIMLDSHFLRKPASLATVSRMLETILSNDSLTIQQKVKNAYLPILENDLIFNKALKFAIEWVNHSFDNACTMLNTLPAHSSLYIGFTNSRYKCLVVKIKQLY